MQGSAQQPRNLAVGLGVRFESGALSSRGLWWRLGDPCLPLSLAISCWWRWCRDLVLRAGAACLDGVVRHYIR